MPTRSALMAMRAARAKKGHERSGILRGLGVHVSGYLPAKTSLREFCSRIKTHTEITAAEGSGKGSKAIGMHEPLAASERHRINSFSVDHLAPSCS
jgi:hypothetical protein